MGFNKIFTPELKELKKKLSEIGEYEFGIYWHKRLMMSDAIIGDSLSIDIIKQFAEKAYNVQESNQKNKV